MPRGDVLVGPGEGCWECRGEYGQHEKDCPVPRKEQERLRLYGESIRNAIKKKDDVALAQLILGGGGR